MCSDRLYRNRLLIFPPSTVPLVRNDSRNIVLCPGNNTQLGKESAGKRAEQAT